MKKMLESKIERENAAMDKTIKGQQDSAVLSEREKRKSLVLELKTKTYISDKETKNALKVTTVTQLLALRAKGIEPPAQWLDVENEIIKNVEIPLFAENMETIDNMLMQQIIDGSEQSEEQQEMNQQPQQEVAA